MQNYYLAVDIGASGGRHMLGHLCNGKMVLEEMYRFPNGMAEHDGELCWDVEQLFREILTGMKKCREAGKIPLCMGIDTWAVDFVLLDKQGRRIGNAVGYRDGRTKGADDLVYEVIPQKELYAATGIQKQIFNTVYQLAAVKRDHPEYLEEAEHLLMLPEYFNYLLTGKIAAEYTNATTTQLVHPQNKDWDMELIDRLGYPKKIFGRIVPPGTVLGRLTEEIKSAVGFDCEVVLPATHDTASAVVAVPTGKEDAVYISSGTWSLLGTERMTANCSKESREHNFTNEGGYQYRFRYLKNIMGLWMIQSVRKELEPELSYGEICEQASKQTIASLVDCNDSRFLAPSDMTKEVQAACAEKGEQVPVGIAEVAAVIYHSLAKCYADAVEELEYLTGAVYDSIHIVGGGANAGYLNELTARATGRTVYAGPVEATAIGNLTVQMITKGELKDLNTARRCIFESFEVQTY
ncbi:MAG: rhamnulokinase [Lachnospiraceae bacterium]